MILEKMNPNLEERTEECIWIMVAETNPNKEKYEKCLSCSGTDKTKPCYVSNKYFKNKYDTRHK